MELEAGELLCQFYCIITDMRLQYGPILEDEINMLKTEHEHKDKLPGVKLPEDMVFTTSLPEAIEGKDILVLAVPSPFTRSTSHNMKPYVADGQIIVNVAKGIEEHTLMTLSQIIEEEVPQANVAVLSVLPMQKK